MQVTELEANGLQHKLKIVVDAAQVNAQVEAELRAAGERVRIPGFRPGFIPMKILQQRYGKSVQADVVKQVLNRASTDALTQKNLRPAAMPKLDLESYPQGGDITFTMTFETLPAITEPAFDKITLDRKTFEIDDAAVDEALENIAARNPKLVPAKSGKAKTGQVLTIDFKGMIDGVAFDGGTAHDFNLELGSGQFIPGFEDQLVGAQDGDDRIVSVTFPAEYHAKNLAGKEASFAVKVKAILDKETPAIDDEFAKSLGFADAAAVREAVREQLKREYDGLVRNDLKKQLFDQLEAACDFELPQSMLDLEFNTIWERLKDARERGEDGSPKGQSEAQLREEYMQIARRRVKLGLLLADVGSKNNIQITREELQRAVWQQASMFPGQEKQVMEFYRNHPERAADLRGPILEEKAVDFILGKVTFNDSKATLEELRAADEEDDAEGEGEKKPKKSAKAKAAKPAEDKGEKETAAKPKSGGKKKAAASE